jgi:hypothetical protein
MTSDLGFVEYICDQMGDAGPISFRCDDRLYVKQTPGGRSRIGTVVEAPAYPGAKPSFLIEDGLDDREWLSGLIRATASELPPPNRKKPRAKRRTG